MDPLRTVLDHLDGVKKTGTGYVAKCPAHDDEHPSLSVAVGKEGRVLLKCFAGCETPDVVGAMGLRMRDLFPRPLTRSATLKPRTKVTLGTLSDAKNIPVGFLAELGAHDVLQGVAIPYRDTNGVIKFERIRKTMNGHHKVHQPQGVPLAAYGQERLWAAREAGYLFVVEGESDCWTLWLNGLPALGIPGANAVNTLTPNFLTDIPRLQIVAEPDEGGHNFVNGLGKVLKDCDWPGQAVVVSLPVKDVNDLWRQNRKGFAARLNAAVDSAVPMDQFVAPSQELSSTDQTSLLDQHYTDMGNAQRFLEHNGDNILFCGPWKKWLIWDDQRWKRDDTNRITGLAKETLAAMFEQAEGIEDDETRIPYARHVLISESQRKIKAMVELTASDVPVVPSQLDSHLMLLNVTNGTVDLSTGKLLPHDRNLRLTKMCPVDFHQDAQCPVWLSFLDTTFGQDQDLLEFLQRAVGYALTGDTGEQVMFIAHGSGANGKSTMLEALRACLGDDYAAQSDFDTFAALNNRSIRNDVARLKGVRFVTAVEAGEGRYLDESLIKQITGGDAITARYLYGEYFEFFPQLKLFLATNHLPKIVGNDEGIWRRLLVIPFTNIIPPHKRDKTLLSRLKSELPGMLAWAVKGCLMWQRDGLRVPPKVRDASIAYRGAQDVVWGFVQESCERQPSATTLSRHLYDAFQSWCRFRGLPPVSTQKFGRRLTEMGFVKGKDGRGNRLWRNICVRTADTADTAHFGSGIRNISDDFIHAN